MRVPCRSDLLESRESPFWHLFDAYNWLTSSTVSRRFLRSRIRQNSGGAWPEFWRIRLQDTVELVSPRFAPFSRGGRLLRLSARRRRRARLQQRGQPFGRDQA